MTPRFSRAVDPIFSYVLNLLDAIHSGENPAPLEQRLAIRGLLEHAEAILGRRREWELACYAIVSWIDEMLVDSTWDAPNGGATTSSKSSCSTPGCASRSSTSGRNRLRCCRSAMPWRSSTCA